MEPEFRPVEVKREPSVEYLLILPPEPESEPSLQGQDVQQEPELVEGRQAEQLGSIEIGQEIGQELVEVKREPSVEFVLILPPATYDLPAPQQAEEATLKRKQPNKKLASTSSVLKCDECSYQTKVKGYLMDHKKTHNKSIECETCEKKFLRNYELKVHQMQHKHGIYATAPEETFDWDICDKPFSTPQSLKQHQSKVHDAKEVKCALCSKMFKNRMLLRQHLQTHVKDECSICKKKVSKLSMADHVRKHSSQNLFMCDLCGHSTKRKVHLKDHIERMHLLRKLVEDSNSRDDFCDSVLLDKLQLQHGSSATTSEKKFKCEKCSKSYVTPKMLNQHKNRHHTEASFQCDICKKSFKVKSTLKLHKAGVHLKVVCSVCNKKVGQRYMKSHMNLHQPGNRFECDLCGYNTERKKWIERHISSKHRSGASKPNDKL